MVLWASSFSGAVYYTQHQALFMRLYFKPHTIFLNVNGASFDNLDLVSIRLGDLRPDWINI